MSSQHSKDDLREALRGRLRRLDELAADFDGRSGSEVDALQAIAKAMARGIVALVHDAAGPSLFGKLNVKRVLRFVNSAIPHDPRNEQTYHGLVTVGTKTGDGPTVSWYVPPGARGSAVRQKNPSLRFDDWWNALVIRDANGAEFTREQVVLAAVGIGPANDGDDLEWRGESGAWMANSPVGPSVRQICYELLETVHRSRRMLGLAPAALDARPPRS